MALISVFIESFLFQFHALALKPYAPHISISQIPTISLSIWLYPLRYSFKFFLKRLFHIRREILYVQNRPVLFFLRSDH